MGKRELLLIAAFVLTGAVIYYATAPAPAPGQSGFSLARLLHDVRRDVRGNPASAEQSSSTVAPIAPSVKELRIELSNTPLTIVGEDRKDLACELWIRAHGYDDAEAKQIAKEARVKLTEAGSVLMLGLEHRRPAELRATLLLKIPRGLAVRIQPSRGKLEISDVVAVELVEARGQVTAKRVSGRLVATHRGGALNLEEIASLKLNTRGSVVTIKDLRGDATLQMQAGELRGDGIAGPLDLESNGTRIALEGLASTKRPVRMNTVGGSVTLAGVASEVRIDGRDTRVTVTIEKPAPLAIYTEGDEPIDVQLPAGGVMLDALATDSRVTVPDRLLDVKIDGDQQRATGAIAGGGPTITLRSVRGDITLKTRKPDA
jgi:hypothetical protein